MFSADQRQELVWFVYNSRSESDFVVPLSFRNGKRAGLVFSLGWDCAIFVYYFSKYLPAGFQVSGNWLSDNTVVGDHCDQLLAEVVIYLIDNCDCETDYLFDWEGIAYG